MKSKFKAVHFLALTLVVTLLFAVIPTLEVQAEPTEQFRAEFGAYLDGSFNENVGSWPDMAEFGGEITFAEGREATIYLNFPSEVRFTGPFAAINTDFPIDELAFAQITSFQLDGVEFPLVAQFINDEGIDGQTRLTLSNTWSGAIEVQPIDLSALPEFTALTISFIVVGDVERTAQFGAYLNASVNPEVDSWPNMADFGGEISFFAGQETTMTLTFPAPVAFQGPFAAINTDFPFTSEVDAQITSLRLDGVEFPLAAQFINNEGIDGQTRLTLSNTWNADIPVQPVDLSTLPEFTTLDVTFIVQATGGTPFVAPPIEFEEFDPYGTFRAFFGMQTEEWTFRNPWTEGSYGLYGSGWDSHGIGHNFGNLTGWDGADAIVIPGTITDVDITGNGRYRVSISGIELSPTDSFLRMLFVSTNIPNTGDVVISDVRVVTGRVWENDAEFRIPEGSAFVEIHVLNTHDNFEMFNNAAPASGAEVYIEFTINGFAGEEYVGEVAEVQVFTPTPVEERVQQQPTATGGGGTDNDGFPVSVIVLIVVGVVVVIGGVLVVTRKKSG